MTDICYDTEFLENGREIRLISIGMVTPGEQYYAINGDTKVLDDAVNHEWLRENVLPSLPVKIIKPGTRGYISDHLWDWEWDRSHKHMAAVKGPKEIAADVSSLIFACPDPVLWADYGAFDHVVLSWLWGPMIAHPDHVPMWTADLRQEWSRLGRPEMPELAGLVAHNALSDAIEVMGRLAFLREEAAKQERNLEQAILLAVRPGMISPDVLRELKGEQR